MQFLLLHILLVHILLQMENIPVLKENDLQKLISDRNGKALVLNIWATWCVPCREEIPDLIKLHQQYSRQADIIGLSVDYPDEVSKRIIPFIKQQNIDYTIFVNGMKDEELINFFNVKWNGAVPATFIFDHKGKMIQFFEGKKKFEVFEKVLKEFN